jgi:DNA-binding winged helix-turn-helix (wHTH) protein
MSYVLNKQVVVNHEGLRTIGTSETELPLTAIPLRILMFLIQNNNRTIKKEEIFEYVWTNHGLPASGTSLAQHLSALRRHLQYFGISSSVIKNIPREGIVFNVQVDTIIPHKKKRQKLKNITLFRSYKFHFKSYHYIFFIIATMLASFMFLGRVSIKSAMDDYVDWHFVANVKGCETSVLNNELSAGDKLKIQTIATDFIQDKNLTCHKTDRILLSIQDVTLINKDDISNDRLFLAYCKNMAGKYLCTSYYYLYEP